MFLTTWQSAVSTIGTFLSGGLTLAALNWFRDSSRDTTVRQAAYLAEQLRLLYGPLSYLATQNDILTTLNARNNHAYKEAYIDKNWSDRPDTQKSIKEETTAAIDLMNRYTTRVHQNNDKMVRLIEDHYSMVDPDDVAAFQQLTTDWLRCQIEIVDGLHVAPYRFQRIIGMITFYRADLCERIRHSCEAKSAALKKLRSAPLSRFSWQKRATAEHASIGNSPEV